MSLVLARWMQRPTKARFFASAGCLRALDAPNHVGGLDKPGHDALKTRPRISRIFRIPRPIASAISDIRQILDFQKYRSNDLVSRKMVHTALVASIATPIVTRTLTACDPRTAIRGHVRQLNILHTILIPMKLFRQRRPKKRKWPMGVTGANSRARTRTRVDAAGAKSSQKNHLQARQHARTRGIAALAREFAPVTYGPANPLKRLNSRKERAWIFFPWLGFSFPKAWIFLP